MRGPYVRACARSMHTVWKWRLVSILRTPELPIIAFQPDALVRPFLPFCVGGAGHETSSYTVVIKF